MAEVKVVRADGSLSVSLRCDDPSLTKQASKDECDINRILKKYEKSNIITHVNKNPGFYDDVSEVPDYQGALLVVQRAEAMFASMPAKLRAEFSNSPAVFLDYVANPDNANRLVELGLAVKKVVVEPKIAESESPKGAV